MDALSSQVYAIRLPSHLLSHPRTQASFLPEDIHICGNCKQSFTDIGYFIQHKTDCNAFISSATAALLGTTSSPVNLQMLSEHPLLEVIINEDNQPVIVQTRSESQNDSSPQTLQSNSEDPNSSVSTLAAAASLLQCSNVNENAESKRDTQIDEEDVASLLANQFAKEAVYTAPDSPPPNDDSGTIVIRDIYVQVKDQNSEQVVVVQNDNDSNTFLQEPTSVETVESTSNNINEDHDKNNKHNSNNDSNSNIKGVTNKDNNSLSSNLQQICIQNGFGIPKQQYKKLEKLTCCNLCSFITVHPSDLTRHMRKHTGERPFECSVCKQRFARKDKLQTHMRVHTGVKPYRCQFCDYAAIDSGPLRKHLRTHTDERPFKCQFCSYSARDTSQLTVHLRKHTGDAPFVCQFEKCGRAFKTSTDLKRHGAVHKKVHLFACKQCDYKASNKLSLRAHNQLSHNKNGGDKCNICLSSGCDIDITNEKELEMHLVKAHSGQELKQQVRNTKNNKKRKCNNHSNNSSNKSHACSFCNHEARTQSSLKQHVCKQHGSGNVGNVKNQNNRPMCQKAYQCNYCPAAFVRQDSLRSHVKQHQTVNSSISESSAHVNKDSSKSVDDRNNVNSNTCDNAVISSDLVIDGGEIFIEDIIENDYIVDFK